MTIAPEHPTKTGRPAPAGRSNTLLGVLARTIAGDVVLDQDTREFVALGAAEPVVVTEIVYKLGDQRLVRIGERDVLRPTPAGEAWFAKHSEASRAAAVAPEFPATPKVGYHGGGKVGHYMTATSNGKTSLCGRAIDYVPDEVSDTWSLCRHCVRVEAKAAEEYPELVVR